MSVCVTAVLPERADISLCGAIGKFRSSHLGQCRMVMLCSLWCMYRTIGKLHEYGSTNVDFRTGAKRHLSGHTYPYDD